MRMFPFALWVLPLCSLCLCGSLLRAQQVTVGSKKFTESVILGELAAHLARDAGANVEHRKQLGGTQVLWQALLAGEIDAYVEYTGTLSDEVVRGARGEDALRAALAERGVVMSRSLGFNNTYALGMKQPVADRLGVRTISDLRNHPSLRLGFSDEFLKRGDGWPSLRDRYGLPQKDVRGLDHDLAYVGLDNGDLDVIDLYSTDAEIRVRGLRVLEDDRHHFPDYHAVLLSRADLAQRAPAVALALRKMEGLMSEAEMIEMNARVTTKEDRVSESRAAADFLERKLGVRAEVSDDSLLTSFWRQTRAHLLLVSISLAAAVLVGLPLGVLAARRPGFGRAILGVVGVVQTIPSLALLVVMIPLLGIGPRPMIAALFLYSLLPIVRNTCAGLTDIPPSIRESAEALGLSGWLRLRLVELPLASRSILAGIKTSAVINVGTATLGAIIGAGGYGEPILTGVRLRDTGLILQGAVPAAALALLVEELFGLAERIIVPKGLRLKAA